MDLSATIAMARKAKVSKEKKMRKLQDEVNQLEKEIVSLYEAEAKEKPIFQETLPGTKGAK